MVVVRTVLRPALVTFGAAITVVALAGRWPSSWWLIDIAASFRVHAGLAALLVVGVALVVRARVVAACVFVAFLACAPALVALVGDDAPDVQVGATRLRVGHLNLQEHDLHVDEILAEIAARRVDVFVIFGARDLDVGRLPDRRGRYRFEAFDPGEQIVLVLDTRRVRRVGPLVHPVRGSAIAFDIQIIGDIEIVRDRRPMHLLALHTPSPLTPGRSATRDRRLDEVAAWAARVGDRAAVFGDLNATPYSAAFDRLLDRSGFSNSLDPHGWQPSWPVRLGRFGIPIDHLLHSADLVTLERDTGPSFGSAHRSLWVTLAVRA